MPPRGPPGGPPPGVAHQPGILGPPPASMLRPPHLPPMGPRGLEGPPPPIGAAPGFFGTLPPPPGPQDTIQSPEPECGETPSGMFI